MNPSRQFVLFLFAGGVAASVNFGSRILMSAWVNYVPAIVIAYCLGMATAFTLNRLFVFQKSNKALRSQLGWFVAVNIAAVAQTLLISLMLAHWAFPLMHINYHNETLAHAIGVAVPVITSYFGHKHLSFAKNV